MKADGPKVKNFEIKKILEILSLIIPLLFDIVEYEFNVDDWFVQQFEN